MARHWEKMVARDGKRREELDCFPPRAKATMQLALSARESDCGKQPLGLRHERSQEAARMLC